MRNFLIRLVILFYTLLVLTVHIKADGMSPADEINAIIERVIQIMTQVGSAVLILFIVKDAFVIVEKSGEPIIRMMIVRDVVLLIIAAIFLFNPNLILDAIKYIANV